MECAISIEVATDRVQVKGYEHDIPEFGRDELQADKRLRAG